MSRRPPKKGSQNMWSACTMSRRECTNALEPGLARQRIKNHCMYVRGMVLRNTQDSYVHHNYHTTHTQQSERPRMPAVGCMLQVAQSNCRRRLHFFLAQSSSKVSCKEASCAKESWCNCNGRTRITYRARANSTQFGARPSAAHMHAGELKWCTWVLRPEEGMIS